MENLLNILAAVYILYLVIRGLAKVGKQQTNKKEPWSLEDALRDLESSTEEQPAMIPVPDRPAPVDRQYTPLDSVESPKYEQPPSLPPRLSVPPKATSHSFNEAPTSSQAVSHPITTNSIASLLKDPKSAREAIILSEILGKPKGANHFPRPNPRP